MVEDKWRGIIWCITYTICTVHACIIYHGRQAEAGDTWPAARDVRLSLVLVEHGEDETRTCFVRCRLLCSPPRRRTRTAKLE